MLNLQLPGTQHSLPPLYIIPAREVALEFLGGYRFMDLIARNIQGREKGMLA
jgi:hypothetical protein